MQMVAILMFFLTVGDLNRKFCVHFLFFYGQREAKLRFKKVSYKERKKLLVIKTVLIK